MTNSEILFIKNSTGTTPVCRPKEKEQTFLWSSEYIISNLPPWVYQQNEEPKTLEECDATICKLEHTIEDIELQIHIRDFELETGTGRQQSKYEHDKWVVQALKAKQTHKYLLSAYKYWRIINSKKEAAATSTGAVAVKLCDLMVSLCGLLSNEPPNFQEEIETLTQKIEDYAELFT